MTTPLRPCWCNCALHADQEIREIDQMEDLAAPIDPALQRIRELITGLELCHHKADRWVENIIEAIAAGETTKGLGTRTPGELHPVEAVWQQACAILSAWCAGCPSTACDLQVASVPASQLLTLLGERSPLKEWQVQRVIEKIRSAIHWPQSGDDPSAAYGWLLLGGGEYECAYRTGCPERYWEHEEFWLATVRTIIRDTVDGNQAALSLGLAIDLLMPCHWRFVENLEIVLAAIGGKLDLATPFAACGRNISLVPLRHRMELVCNTLQASCDNAPPGQEVDDDILSQLGKISPAKRWLAASLDKTIRLQLQPPAELRAISDLQGPEWITQRGAES
jgi:hypothetical protein